MEALLLSSQSANTYSSIAFVHTLMGHTDEAVDWFHKALSLKNDDSFCTTMLNYVIELLSEEKPPYPSNLFWFIILILIILYFCAIFFFLDAPDYIPNFNIQSRPFVPSENVTLEESQSINAVASDMSMSIEVDMSDASGMVKEQ